MNKYWLALFMATVLLSCGKENVKPKPDLGINLTIGDVPSNGPFLPVIVNVNQNVRGIPVPPKFEGLSFETAIFSENPDYINADNTVLVQLLKNLGGGVLRIGGNTSDLVKWTGSARTAETPINSVTTTDIDHLSQFSHATGWPVMFGLNLANNNPTMAANEAKYVNAILKNNLYDFQSGNEPDVFALGHRSPGYNFNSYMQEWNNYLAAVRQTVPKAHFAGPDITGFNKIWISSFAASENKNINLLDVHYYAAGPSFDSLITYRDILKPNSRLTGYLANINSQSSEYYLPFRISECNSVFDGGKPGVSDVFASALWALDFMWTVAANNGQGVNFHGSDNRRFVYSPIVMDNGEVTAKPEYYAMLAFKFGSAGGTIIPASIPVTNTYNCSAFACAHTDNTYTITLVNKDISKNIAYTVNLTKAASKIIVARLAAPAIDSKTGVTFAGSTVNTDGTFKPVVTEAYVVNGKSFEINVPAGSAAVVTVR